jgi:membrane dipeptidase
MNRNLFLAVAGLAVLSAPSSAQQQSGWQPPSDPALVARARAIHDRVMTLDTHVDISANQFNAQDTVNFVRGVPGRQVDLPKMEQGGLDAVFLAVYVGQGPLDSAGYASAYRQAVAKFDAIQRLAKELAPDRVGLALTAADARRIYASGKKVIFAGIENGYPVGTDISRVKEFYDRGGRYMSLSHNGNAQAQASQLSDANTGERAGFLYNNGLSPLGREVIKEMNKYGIMVDFSHPSKGAMMEMLRLSKAPIMGSHSGVRAVCNHSRNADDEQLRALAQNRGVIQLVAFASYVKCDPVRDSLRTAATAALNAEFGVVMPTGGRGGGGGGGRGGAGGGGGGGRGGGRGGNAALDSILNAMPEDRRNAYRARQAEIAAKYPAATRATVSDFADHIDYAKKLIGVDYIGISSDFDGGGGVDGWNSATETFNVTLELVKRGYTEAEIAKIWSGNLLRVLEETERVAKDIQSGKIKVD